MWVATSWPPSTELWDGASVFAVLLCGVTLLVLGQIDEQSQRVNWSVMAAWVIVEFVGVSIFNTNSFLGRSYSNAGPQLAVVIFLVTALSCGLTGLQSEYRGVAVVGVAAALTAGLLLFVRTWQLVDELWTYPGSFFLSRAGLITRLCVLAVLIPTLVVFRWQQRWRNEEEVSQRTST